MLCARAETRGHRLGVNFSCRQAWRQAPSLKTSVPKSYAWSLYIFSVSFIYCELLMPCSFYMNKRVEEGYVSFPGHSDPNNHTKLY